MKIYPIEKNAVFLDDDKGVIIVTDIEKSKDVFMAELLYDGKNVVVLNRNNDEFYSLKNIVPPIREKIKQSKRVTIVEKGEDNIYSYQVEVHLQDDLGFADDFDVFATKLMSDIKNKMKPEEYEEFLREADKLAQ